MMKIHLLRKDPALAKAMDKAEEVRRQVDDTAERVAQLLDKTRSAYTRAETPGEEGVGD